MLKPADRHAFILKWLNDKGGSIDVLYKDFVDAFATHTGARMSIAPFGANWCKTLSRDMGDMYRAGILTRYACGLPTMRGYGFPKWCYVYRLPEPCPTFEQHNGVKTNE